MLPRSLRTALPAAALALLVANLPPAPALAESAASKAGRYLGYFQYNVRIGSKQKKLDWNWEVYARQAERAGMTLWDRGAVRRSILGGTKVKAVDAPRNGQIGWQDLFPNDGKDGGPRTKDDGRTKDVDAGGRTPRSWDFAYHGPTDADGRSANGEALPYVKDLARRMAQDLIGSSASFGQGYFAQNYSGYDRRVNVTGRGKVYIRHLGFDVRAKPGTPVRAVAPGVVTAVVGNVKNPMTPAVVVKERGAERWWVYGHIVQGVKRGARIKRGQVVGRLVDQRREWKHTHLHVTVFTSGYPLPKKVKRYFGWGRTYHPDVRQAITLAQRHSMHPLEAYARANGLRY